ncbi:MAG TPA: hypothetical protein VML19_19470 [Verrucomicrobiae bacterium]|nr:hypothetical protein [Verrucomicrobiae bacterium]
MRFVKTVLPTLTLIPAAILVIGGLMAPTPGFSTKKYSDDNGKKPCTTCHAKMGAPDAMHKEPNLNAVGQCFQKADHKGLDACIAQNKK